MSDQVLYSRSAAQIPPLKQDGVDLDLMYGLASRQRVLIIDDDPDTVSLLKVVMSRAGYDVISAMGCVEALKKCSDFPPHMILLDLMMPDIDGYQTFTHLRQVSTAPVIIISAKDAKDDVVTGLRSGADDYITKPFYNAEVVERVKTVLRRANTPEPKHQLSFPNLDLAINLDSQEVTLRDQPVHFASREFSVLALLAKQAPRKVTLKTIGLEIWGEDTPDTRKRIKYLIYLIRKKMEVDPKHPVIIPFEGAFGYRLNSNINT